MQNSVSGRSLAAAEDRSRHSPIAVKQDDDIGSDQIDTQTSGSCRQQEDELFAPWLVVFVDRSRSRFVIGTSVDTTVFYTQPLVSPRGFMSRNRYTLLTVSSELTIVLQNIQDTAHLREDQDSRIFLLHSLQKSVEDPHFVRIVD
jgi:hypothetical protein